MPRTALDRIVIAVDGTSGSGKSSASKAVAQALGLRYLDTGAMYRAMTWAMLRDHVDLSDPEAIAARADEVRIQSGTDPAAPSIAIGSTDLAVAVRGDDVTSAVSLVSAVPQVRSQLVAEQRAIIGLGGIVVEGRDIATSVWPSAEVQVYLTADPAARAARRAAESGNDIAATQASLQARDEIDTTRAASPLSKAPNAVHIDSSHLTLEQVIEQIVALAIEATSE